MATHTRTLELIKYVLTKKIYNFVLKAPKNMLYLKAYYSPLEVYFNVSEIAKSINKIRSSRS